jgi:hypothetical protein
MILKVLLEAEATEPVVSKVAAELGPKLIPGDGGPPAKVGHPVTP